MTRVEATGEVASPEGKGQRWLLAVALLAGVAVFLVAGPDGATIARQAREWREAARANLPLALTVFVAAEVAVIALWLPVGIWMTVLAGFLFDVWVGTLVVSFASTAGAVLAFLSARYLFRDAIHRAARRRPRFRRGLARIDAGFREHGAYYVLLLRLTPVFPFFLLNLGLGLTRVRLRDYWWATQLGMLPVTFVVANAGASLGELESAGDVLSPRLLGSLCLLPVVPLLLHRATGRWLARGRAPA